MAGFVYVMSNPGFDGRVKIGKSIKDPTTDRVQELNSTTSVPEPFKVEYYCYVDDFDQLESTVHRLLQHARPNRNREFFSVDLVDAVRTIQETANELGGIKFEEFYFDPALLTADLDAETNIQEPAEFTKDNFERKTNIDDLISQFPNAFRVIEYNSTAKNYFDQVANVPGKASEEFLAFLEKEPNISENHLRIILKEPAFARHLQPFNDIISNYFLGLCLKIGPQISLDFKTDLELLQPTITPKKIFTNLCLKHNLLVDEFDIEGAVFVQKVAANITSLAAISIQEVQYLFAELGLDISYDWLGYHIYADGKRLSSGMERDGVLKLMQEGLSVNILVAAKERQEQKNIAAKERQEQKNIVAKERQEQKDIGLTSKPAYSDTSLPDYKKEREKSGALLGIAFALLAAVAAAITGVGWLVVVMFLVMVFLSVKKMR